MPATCLLEGVWYGSGPTEAGSHDLFLDVWQSGRDAPRLLDEDELRQALRTGVIEEVEGAFAIEEARRILGLARRRRWPPAIVRRWPLEAVPSLRFRRDAPGSYYANLASTRVIAFGLYLLGGISLTSIFFAAFTDALVTSGTAQRIWLYTLAGEAAILLPFSLMGRLPATERARPAEAMSERTLVVGAVVTALAVLLLNRSELWRDLLVTVYASLAFFLTLFATCRAWFDREIPLTALAGLALCLVAFIVLL